MDSNGSWRDAVVRAGATQPAYVAEVTGLHPELFFRFRVKSPAECEAMLVDLRTNKDAIGVMEKAVSECLTSWSIDAPLTTKLRHPLLKRVFWIVIQNEPSDPIPDSFNAGEGVDEQAKK